MPYKVVIYLTSMTSNTVWIKNSSKHKSKSLQNLHGVKPFWSYWFLCNPFWKLGKKPKSVSFYYFFLQTNLSSKSSISNNHNAHQRTLFWFYSLTKNSLEKVLPAFASEMIWVKDYSTLISYLVNHCSLNNVTN